MNGDQTLRKILKEVEEGNRIGNSITVQAILEGGTFDEIANRDQELIVEFDYGSEKGRRKLGQSKTLVTQNIPPLLEIGLVAIEVGHDEVARIIPAQRFEIGNGTCIVTTKKSNL